MTRTERRDRRDQPPVFILGAGFSKAIDQRLPTSEELGEKVRTLLSQNGTDLPENLLRGTFEEWLSRLAEEQPDLLEHENLHRRAWFSEISRAVARVIEVCEAEVREDATTPPWLRSFIGAAHGWRATVLTFNYDTLLERAVNASCFHDFCAPFPTRVRSCDVLGHLPPPAGSAEGGPYHTFHLLKLHGSVSFFRPPGDDVGAFFVRWPLDGEGHILPKNARELLASEILAANGLATASLPPGRAENPEERRKRLLFGYEPFIVPPAALKSPYYRSTFLRGLWRAAREAISRARDIYLVGYSLPQTDLVTVGLLRENLPSDARVFVVNRPINDPHENVADRAERLLGRQIEELHPDSPEAIKLWATELAETRSRKVLNSLLDDLPHESHNGGNQFEKEAHVTVYPDSPAESPNCLAPWCLDNSNPQTELKCIRRPEKDPPRWEIARLRHKIRSLLEEQKPFVVTGSDNKKRVVVDSYVERPRSERQQYFYEIHLQLASYD